MADEKQAQEIANAVEHFSGEMRGRLVANLRKGRWRDESSAYLLRRLLQEVADLVEALDDGTPESIGGKAVDVANFAMMIADPGRLANVME